MVFSFRLCCVRVLASLLCIGLLLPVALPDKSAMASVATGMNAYWDFNEPGGTTAANSGTAGATLDGTLLGSTSFVAGLFGNAVRLPGADADYVNVANQVVTNGQAAYTVSAWFNPADVKSTGGRRQVLFESAPNYALSAGLAATNNRVQHFVATPGYHVGTTTFQPQQEQWHHLAIAYTHNADTNQGTSKIYIDGVEHPGAQITSAGTLASTTSFRIGRHRSTNGYSFNGLMDDMAIWDRTLSGSEIAAIAGLGRASAVDLGGSVAIDNVLALNAPGQSAAAGPDTWHYTNSFVAPASGNLAPGSNYEGIDGHKYIVLGGTYKDGFTGVATNAASAPSLIGDLTAYWDFNEAAGETVAHNSNLASGLAAGRAALNGTLQGGADIDFAAGKFGNAVRMDGSGTNAPNVYVPSQVIANGQTAYTLSLWLQPDDVKESGGRRQVIFETGLNYPISVDLTPGDNVIRQHVETMRGDGSAYSPVLPTGVRPEQGEWHHLAIRYTFDPDAPYTLSGETYYGRGTQQIYLDGVAIGAPVVTDGVLRDTTFARIGIRRGSSAAGTTGTALNGLIDDTALWNRSLDARTIAAVAGLGHVSGVSLNGYTAIESVLALNAVGQSAAAGSDTWHYTNSFVAPATGRLTAGRSYEGVDGHHYIVLDGSHKNGFTGVATASAPSLIGGLTAYWDFNEAAGQNVVKNSNLAAGLAAGREALDGSLLNDVALVSGKFGNAVELSGEAHNYVDVSSQVIANGQEEYTISTWFNPAEIGTRRQVLFESGGNYALSAGLDTNTNRIRHYVQATGGAQNSITLVTPAQDEWHHLAITYTFDADTNQGTSKIFIDGVEYTGNQLTSIGELASTTYFRMGSHRSNNAVCFNGLMDDTAIWSRSLDARTIAAVAGLGHVSGVSLNDYTAIENVLALNAAGQSAAAGSDTWHYANSFVAPAAGNLAAGRSYEGVDGHHYIVLDGSHKNGFTGVATASAPSLIGGLTAYWDFNEAPGATVAKNSNLASGLAAGRAALDGTLVGAADIDFAAGKFGNAVALNGQSGNAPNVYVPSQVIADGQTAYTLSLWFQPDDVKESGGRRQVIFETGATYPISVDLGDGSNLIRQHVETKLGDGSSSTTGVVSNVRPEEGQWHHLAIAYTFDPDAPYTVGGETYYGRGTQQLYVDGVAVGSPITRNGVLHDTTFARIGIRRGSSAAGTTGTALNGLIDDTALWSRSLDARTIATIAGLGHVSGVSLNDYTAIENVLLLSAVGQSAAAGPDTWHYANAMVAPAGGGSFAVGRNYEGVDGNHYIVLDGSYKSGFTGVGTAAPSLIGGLTAYWDFNEAPGQTVVKNSNLAAGLAAGREALDGTLLNDVTLVPGRFGNAVSLPGQPHNYVNVASQVVANGQEEYTLSMWFSPSEIGARRQVLFETGGSYAMSAGLAATTNRVQHYVETTGSTPSSTATFQPAEDEWHHLAITYTFDAGLNQGTSKIYIDGVEYTGNQLTSIGELASTTFARIGAHRSDSDAWGTGFCFAGLIDDTAVWSRALDGRSIAAMAGLGALAGLDLNSYGGIDAVLSLDGPGQSATAGNLTWNFTDTFDNLPASETLTAGMHYIGTNGRYYIVLGGNSQQGFTGVWAVPEPGTFGLLLSGLLALLALSRRRRGFGICEDA